MDALHQILWWFFITDNIQMVAGAPVVKLQIHHLPINRGKMVILDKM
jgi:hypothetical protein